MSAYYSKDELKELGLQNYGQNILLSRKASIYSPGNIELGDNVRIDDFCILSGSIKIGSNVHISAYSALYGRFGIEMKDYSGLSPRSTIFSAIDDFSGESLIGPMVDETKTRLISGVVKIMKFVQVGANSTVFPNITIHEGSAIGAHSLVNRDIDPWGIYAGIPVHFIKERKRKLLELLG